MIRGLIVSAALIALCAVSFAQDHAAHGDHGPTIFHKIELETAYTDDHGGVIDWDLHGWIGGDAERVWLRSEGAIEDGDVHSAEAQIFYGWNFDDFWDVLVGVRHDFEPDGRTYAAIGLVGMLPYFIETEATLFLSEDGDLTARFEHEIDIRLTQDLVLEPHIELNLAAEDDPKRGTGAGITDVEASLQLRYEIIREIAPFVEVSWERKLGETALIARAAGGDVEETSVHIGLKIWF
jgi:copper resistance protein B